MQITKNTVVQFHYTLTDENEELGSSHGQEPVLYLQGSPGLLPGLVEALEGHSAGDEFDVTLPPEKAYGLRQEGAIEKVQLKRLHGAKKWSPGMPALLEVGENDYRDVTIVKVGHSQVQVDTNHPLAGKSLTFKISIVDVREASQDEIAHGHAHGPGGHHHH